MRKALREISLAQSGNLRPSADVGRIKPRTNPKMRADQAAELREILKLIDLARQKLAKEGKRPDFTSMEKVARASGHGIATWHAWRRKAKPTSPKFFDLRDFTRAVGMDVRVIGQDAIDATGSSDLGNGVGRGQLKPETMDVVEWMESEHATDELRSAIRKLVQGEITRRAANPHGADEQMGSLVRSSKS